MRAGTLIDNGVAELEASPSIDHWQKGRERIEAEDLLGFLLGYDPEPSEPIPKKIRARFDECIERRAEGEPVPYIKGFADFKGLEILVRPGVFVPRDSSEFLADQAIRRLRGRRSPVLVDLATGAGPIALAVADAVPKAKVVGADLSPKAVKLARKNSERLGVPVRFVVGDLFAPVPKKLKGNVDVVTLHPPYVGKDEIADLPDEIRAWEPVDTLTDHSADGMALSRRVIAEAPDWLRANGWLLLEGDPDRARDFVRELRKAGFIDIKTTVERELKVTRVVVARRPPKDRKPEDRKT